MFNPRKEISMQVTFESRDPEAIDLQPVAERRVRLALRRLSWLAPRARVQMSDVNGPRGGIDKRCQIELTTDATGPVIVTSMARDWRSALHSAVARAAKALLHNWQQTRQVRRVQRHARPVMTALPSVS
jgi:hypothetical protein